MPDEPNWTQQCPGQQPFLAELLGKVSQTLVKSFATDQDNFSRFFQAVWLVTLCWKQLTPLFHFCENCSNPLTTICLTKNILKLSFKYGVEMLNNLAIWDVVCIFLHLLQPVWWFLASRSNKINDHIYTFLLAERASLDFYVQKQSMEQSSYVLGTDNSYAFPPTSSSLKISVYCHLASFIPKHLLLSSHFCSCRQ